MAEYRVGAVAPDVAARIWPRIENYIAAALKRGGMERAYYPTDILAHVLRGTMHLWVVSSETDIPAAFVTRINEYDRCRTCGIFLLGGGGMKEWLPQVIAESEAYARRIGCIAMEVAGRAGWVRAAGYKQTGVSLTKEL